MHISRAHHQQKLKMQVSNRQPGYRSSHRLQTPSTTNKIVIFMILCSVCNLEFKNIQAKPIIKFIKSDCDEQVQGKSLIHGGKISPREKWPWLVTLSHKNGHMYFCGGTIISERHIITAAHCIQDKGETFQKETKDVIITMGVWNISDHSEENRIEVVPLRFHIHQDWNPKDTRWDADITIIELAEDITFTRYIQPACLWTPDLKPASKNDGGMVVGW